MLSIFSNWKTSVSALAAILGFFLSRRGIILPPEFADALGVVFSAIGLLFAHDAKPAKSEQSEQ